MSAKMGLRGVGVAAAFALALVGAAGDSRAASDSDDAIWERAGQAYLKGDYKAAIEGYELLLAAGIGHQDLHYNLGNAYAQADKLGPAILHYELAVALDPTAEDARANLELVRQQAATRFADKVLGAEQDPAWQRALASFHKGNLAVAFVALYLSLFALAVVLLFVGPGFVRVALAALAVFVGVGALGTGVLLGARHYVDAKVEQAIVLPDEVAVKEGPDASDKTSFAVHAGLKLRLVEHDGDWARVRLPNGLEGWVRAPDMGRL